MEKKAKTQKKSVKKTTEKKSKVFKTDNIKIGITLGLKDNKESIWTNGIKQNVLMLIRLLKNSNKNYQVKLLNTIELDWSEKPGYLKDVDVCNFKDNYMDMDFIIVMGAQIHNDEIKKFKESGNKKVVSYKCGNNYVITMENILFKDDNEPKSFQYEEDYDEVWYIPQQDEVNRGFYKTLYRTNSFIVPFVWHNQYLLEALTDIEKGFKKGQFKKDYRYEIGKEKKRIGVMEPNLNIVKFSLIPAMVAEECYRGEIGKNHIEKLMLTNSEKISKNKEFMSMIKTFDLFKDGKITGESRYQTAYILSQYIDVLLCHQILNPLNYLYLDAAYMGYPVLHNATLCKDLGYYYEGSDTVEGAKQLDYILTEHDKNIDAYNERNDKVLMRYYADNMDLVETYDKLIYNLFNGGNKDLVYDPTTNLYKNLK
jgi:hypothetical protein